MGKGCFASLDPLIDDLKGMLEGYRETNLQKWVLLLVTVG